jgi:hypothetical protein
MPPRRWGQLRFNCSARSCAEAKPAIDLDLFIDCDRDGRFKCVRPRRHQAILGERTQRRYRRDTRSAHCRFFAISVTLPQPVGYLLAVTGIFRRSTMKVSDLATSARPSVHAPLGLHGSSPSSMAEPVPVSRLKSCNPEHRIFSRGSIRPATEGGGPNSLPDRPRAVTGSPAKRHGPFRALRHPNRKCPGRAQALLRDTAGSNQNL